jgi:hypothetical protein
VRLVYADESGDDKDLTLYAFVEVDPAEWTSALSQWMNLRRALRDDLSIPTRYELHAVKFLAGRGNPSHDPEWNRKKGLRIEVGRRITETLAQMPIHLRVTYVSSSDRRLAYRAAIRQLESDLRRSSERAMVMVDGDGSDPTHLEVHRDMPLESRLVIEDPWHQGAHTNQWIMIADWVAYLAFQSLRRNNHLVSGWYGEILAPLDVNSGPIRC